MKKGNKRENFAFRLQKNNNKRMDSKKQFLTLHRWKSFPSKLLESVMSHFQPESGQFLKDRSDRICSPCGNSSQLLPVRVRDSFLNACGKEMWAFLSVGIFLKRTSVGGACRHMQSDTVFST